MALEPEQRAREAIDDVLRAAGWLIQDMDEFSAYLDRQIDDDDRRIVLQRVASPLRDSLASFFNNHPDIDQTQFTVRHGRLRSGIRLGI